MPVQSIDTIRIMRGVIKIGAVGASEAAHTDYGEFVPGQSAINFEGAEVVAKGGYSRRKMAVAITEDGLNITAQLLETAPASLAAVLGFEGSITGTAPNQTITAILSASKSYYSVYVYGYDQNGRYFQLHIPKASFRKQASKLDIGGTTNAFIDVIIDAIEDGTTTLYTLINAAATTTALPAPTPVPADLATGVALTVAPTLTFARAVSAVSGNLARIKLYDMTAKAYVANAMAYDSTLFKVTITPSANLTTAHNYAILIDRNFEDTFGNKLATDFTSTFTTV